MSLNGMETPDTSLPKHEAVWCWMCEGRYNTVEEMYDPTWTMCCSKPYYGPPKPKEGLVSILGRKVITVEECRRSFGFADVLRVEYRDPWEDY